MRMMLLQRVGDKVPLAAIEVMVWKCSLELSLESKLRHLRVLPATTAVLCALSIKTGSGPTPSP